MSTSLIIWQQKTIIQFKKKGNYFSNIGSEQGLHRYRCQDILHWRRKQHTGKEVVSLHIIIVLLYHSFSHRQNNVCATYKTFSPHTFYPVSRLSTSSRFQLPLIRLNVFLILFLFQTNTNDIGSNTSNYTTQAKTLQSIMAVSDIPLPNQREQLNDPHAPGTPSPPPNPISSYQIYSTSIFICSPLNFPVLRRTSEALDKWPGGYTGLN